MLLWFRLSQNLSAETVVMDAAAGELDKKIALSGLFTVEWSQARERWLRCRKMMESTQRRAEDAREKWQSFETDITDKREAVKKLLEQLVQALDNAKNGVKDVSNKICSMLFSIEKKIEYLFEHSFP